MKYCFGVKFEFDVPIWKEVSGAINNIDPGQAKVAFATVQIIASVSSSLSIKYPEPMASFCDTFAILNMDFLSADCLKGANFQW